MIALLNDTAMDSIPADSGVSISRGAHVDQVNRYPLESIKVKMCACQIF